MFTRKSFQICSKATRASGHPGQGHSHMDGAGTMGLLTWGWKTSLRIDHKQCELRFNYQDQDLHKLLINIIRKKPLF